MGTIGRRLFFVTVAWGALSMALAPRLPMVDLPQHAAQIGLLRDLISGGSPWEHLVRINLFTPYLAEYGLALLLSMVMPIHAAFASLLALAFLGFVAACRRLRRDMDGDERLDWLFVLGFFGFAWKFGFVTFLVAAPIGIVFLLLARRHAERPTPKSALSLGLAGLLLFFSHGLLFLFAALAGAALLLAHRSLSRARGLLPLAPFGALCILAASYNLLVLQADPAPNQRSTPVWDGGLAGTVDRLKTLFVHPFGLRQDRQFAALALLAFCAPWALGSRWNRARRGFWIPFALVVLVILAAPSSALKADYIPERFALFLLPFYALLFTRPASETPAPRAHRTMASLTATALMLGCWTHLAVHTARLRAFARESAAADHLLSLIPPGKRVLSLVVDHRSPAAGNPSVYLHHVAWYQSERRGFVDLNFAYYVPQIVRFRDGCTPGVTPGFESRPLTFDFHRHRGRIYDYFVVRDNTPSAASLTDRLLTTAECHVELAAASGDWLLFARRECRFPPPPDCTPGRQE